MENSFMERNTRERIKKPYKTDTKLEQEKKKQ